MNIPKLSKSLILVAVLVLILVSAALVSGDTSGWKGPGDGVIPPNNNTPPPINVGSELQTKQGILEVNNLFRVFDSTYLRGKVLIKGGNDQNYPWSFFEPNDGPGDKELAAAVVGRIGADEYCDKKGFNCFTAASVGTGGGGGGGGGGVTSVSGDATQPITANPQTGAVKLTLGIAPYAGLSVDQTTGFKLSLARYCSTGQILKRTVNGWECADLTPGGSGGDNLGNHTTTKNLKVIKPNKIDFVSGSLVKSSLGLSSGNQLDLTGKVRIYDAATGLPATGGAGKFLAANSSGEGVWKSLSITKIDTSCTATSGVGEKKCKIGTPADDFCSLTYVPDGMACEITNNSSGEWWLRAKSVLGTRTCRASCLRLVR